MGRPRDDSIVSALRHAAKHRSRDGPAALPLLALALSAHAASDESSPARDVRLLVTDSGQYILEDRPVDLADLRAKLRELKAGGRPINLHVVAGTKPAYRFIAPAMQIVQDEGLGKVGVMTTAPAASGAAASR